MRTLLPHTLSKYTYTQGKRILIRVSSTFREYMQQHLGGDRPFNTKPQLHALHNCLLKLKIPHLPQCLASAKQAHMIMHITDVGKKIVVFFILFCLFLYFILFRGAAKALLRLLAQDWGNRWDYWPKIEGTGEIIGPKTEGTGEIIGPRLREQVRLLAQNWGNRWGEGGGRLCVSQCLGVDIV